MSSVTTVYASFRYVDLVRIVGGDYFTTLSSAYSSASNGNTIQARIAIFHENLVLDKNITIILKGGYDASFSDNHDVSTLDGVLTIRQGTAVIENFVIR